MIVYLRANMIYYYASVPQFLLITYFHIHELERDNHAEFKSTYEYFNEIIFS